MLSNHVYDVQWTLDKNILHKIYAGLCITICRDCCLITRYKIFKKLNRPSYIKLNQYSKAELRK